MMQTQEEIKKVYIILTRKWTDKWEQSIEESTDKSTWQEAGYGNEQQKCTVLNVLKITYCTHARKPLVSSVFGCWYFKNHAYSRVPILIACCSESTVDQG